MMNERRCRAQRVEISDSERQCQHRHCRDWFRLGLRGVTLLLVASVATAAAGQDDTEAKAAEEEAKPVFVPLKPAAGWLRLTRDYDVWIDMKKKQVIVGGEVCLREGMLEMFACPKGTKEHESVVSVNSPARFVHAGLVALGAKPGPPVQFAPAYKPAQGTVIDVKVFWKDEQGKEHRAKAQDWVKQIKTGKALEYPWVFAGSGFWTDEAAGERFYYADGGEFICVSNFSTAMLDLPVESSDANDTLMFAAFTERIPRRGTPVQLILTPQLAKPDTSGADSGSKKGGEQAKEEVPPLAPKKPQDTPAKTGTEGGGKTDKSSPKKIDQR